MVITINFVFLTPSLLTNILSGKSFTGDVLPCFVLRYLYTCFVVPPREGSAALHVV